MAAASPSVHLVVRVSWPRCSCGESLRRLLPNLFIFFLFILVFFCSCSPFFIFEAMFVWSCRLRRSLCCKYGPGSNGGGAVLGFLASDRICKLESEWSNVLLKGSSKHLERCHLIDANFTKKNLIDPNTHCHFVDPMVM